MTARRPVQTSFMDGMDRPVGPIPLSVQRGTNADLMSVIAPLYLTGSVLDTTYGRGKWWARFTPDPFTFHDIDVDGVDFTDLPYGASSFDTVCFDPPYTPAGGKPTSDAGRFRTRFGLTPGRTSGELNALVMDGLAECCRVTRTWLLVKCMEFVAPAGFRDMPTEVTNTAAGLGFTLHDRIVHFAGTGPGGHNIYEVKRARRAHSYLLVFTPETPVTP